MCETGLLEERFLNGLITASIAGTVPWTRITEEGIDGYQAQLGEDITARICYHRKCNQTSHALSVQSDGVTSYVNVMMVQNIGESHWEVYMEQVYDIAAGHCGERTWAAPIVCGLRALHGRTPE